MLPIWQAQGSGESCRSFYNLSLPSSFSHFFCILFVKQVTEGQPRFKQRRNRSATNLIASEQSESCSVMSDSLWPHGLYSTWNSPGQNTELGSLSLLQQIFPIQESNRGLLHYRQILYQLSYQGSPKMILCQDVKKPPNHAVVILEPPEWNLSWFPLFPHLFAMKWWDQMPWSLFSECWV